jgi:hypothetical protein
MAVAAVHVRSWQVGYRGLVPDNYLDEPRPEDRAGRSRSVRPPQVRAVVATLADRSVVDGV